MSAPYKKFKISTIVTALALLGATASAMATTYTMRVPLKGVSASTQTSGGSGGSQPANTYTNIFAGEYGNTALFVKPDGTVAAAGDNTYGQFGLGSTSGYVMAPVAETYGGSPVSGILGAATTWYNSYILRGDGTLLSAGDNSQGQLANWSFTNSATFVSPYMNAGPFTQVAAGDHFVAVIKNGVPMMAGDNSFGQLANGTTNRSSTFSAGYINSTTQLTGVVQIAAGRGTTYAITGAGKFYAAGNGGAGEVGLGVGTNFSYFFSPLSGVSSMAAGGYHALALKTDGTVWGAGMNSYGQLGDGTTNNVGTYKQLFSGAKAVYAGNASSYIIANDGSLWVSGYNADGELGDGTKTNRTAFTQVLTGVTKVIPQNFGAFAIRNDGSVWATGNGNTGVFGVGTTVAYTTWTQIYQ